ncbi:hypothetical protein [Curtobacterium sp. MCBD17_040]|uniref:hypothetical protein n=1 Tax=Curtobacterium sp. MCBD17_040 TaxID=2175674 RepID=UPI000DA880F2|nr:hypothetical protein [Curtobacterium sp. MCBD17_040]WIB65468.1 hypothetical protein DEI94_19030 [Curtobacterium sp. MCBD17_040]
MNEPTFLTKRVRLRTAYDYEAAFRYGGVHLWPLPKRPVQGPLIDPELREGWMREWQIRAATEENARRWSKHTHESIDLYVMSDDCGHGNPENDDDAYDFDLIEQLEHAVTSLRVWTPGEGFVINDQTAYDAAVTARDSHPEYIRCVAAQDEYDDLHGSGICLASPLGSVCVACAESHGTGSDDFGYESHGCLLASDASEAFNEFWGANGDEDGRPSRFRPAATAPTT